MQNALSFFFSLSLLLSLGIHTHAESVTTSKPVSKSPILIATGEYPPWTSSKLEHGGFINHIVAQAFEKSGLTVQFEYLPWNRALEATRLGKYHATSFWGYKKERDQDFLLSTPFNPVPFRLFHLKNRQLKEWSTLKDLNEFSFGATRGYTYTSDFWSLFNQGELKVSIANEDLDNFRKLLAGQIDIFLISGLTGNYLLREHFSDQERERLTVHHKVLYPDSSGDFVLFPKVLKGSAELVKKFNEGFAKLKSEQLLEDYQTDLINPL